MTILYIGNNLSRNSKYHSAFSSLKNNLRSEKHKVITASSQKNQLLRLLDIVWTVLLHAKKVDYILIDTFSTSAFYFAFISSQLARLFQTKYIPILHGGNLPSRLENSPKMSKMIFNNSFVNVAPSGYLLNAFEKKGYNTYVIPNTIDIQIYPFKERNLIEPKLLYVRAFAQIYNPNMALEVLKLVQEKYPKATLCMVGPDRDGTLQAFRKQMIKMNLEEHIKITGVLPKEEWHQLSKEYDVFINTTNIDNTPVSLLEAMALGLPIVSTNVGGIPYLVEEDKEGVLVAPNDAFAMASGIVKLLENSENTNRLSKIGRTKVEQMDWQVVKKEWAKILA